MLDRRVRQGRYPRKTVKIDVSVYRRNVFAMSERARLDKIIIRRCGKDKWVSAHPECARVLERLAFGKQYLGARANRKG